MAEFSEQDLYIGIDIGTTSVKVCLVDFKKQVLSSASKAIPTSGCNFEDGKSEFPVWNILETIMKCILELPKQELQRVVRAGVCGQMHGICLWKNRGAGSTDSTSPWDSLEASPLYTWMDQRCDPEFLGSLPKPRSDLRVSTGHGTATLFWLSRRQPEELMKYDSAGTIMDLFVTFLCELKEPIMSTQNAAGWGYFCTQSMTWNLDILSNASFPIKFLPKVYEPCSSVTIGKLHKPFCGLPVGVQFGPPLGDIQCSILSTELDSKSAFVNISTSAQLAFIIDPSEVPQREKGQIEYLPYFDGKLIGVGASLNGGNVLASFVGLLRDLTSSLGVHEGVNNREQIWNTILSQGMEVDETNLIFEPTLFGERHSPSKSGSLQNISFRNFNVGHLTRSLCKGIIQNCIGLVSKEVLVSRQIRNVFASGSAIVRNPILQDELRKCLDGFDVELKTQDAAYGAAISCIQLK